MYNIVYPSTLPTTIRNIMFKPVLLFFKFDDFKGLTAEVDKCVVSDTQTDSHRNGWFLELYPGGQSLVEGELPTEEDQAVWIGLCLGFTGKEKQMITVKYEFGV